MKAMKIFVTAKPRSKKQYAGKIDDSHGIREKLPAEGRANIAVIRTLEEHLHIAPSRLRSGHASRSE